ncbi:hypothetical protein D1872_228390 [compost metagenome]
MLLFQAEPGEQKHTQAVTARGDQQPVGNVRQQQDHGRQRRPHDADERFGKG